MGIDLQWGTFQRPYNVDQVRFTAIGALRDLGYQVFSGDEAYAVLGGSDPVNITVSFAPEGDRTWIMVAVGTSDGTAERVRNAVRGRFPEHPGAPGPMPRLPHPTE